jgi:hypothetical protein
MNIKLLLGNAGNNEENNCKPDQNRSKLLGHWLVFKIHEISLLAPTSSNLRGTEFFNYFSRYFLT